MFLLTRIAELFESWIDPLRQTDDLTPPNNIWGFFWHYVRQAKLAFIALMVANGLTGALEAMFLFYVGRLVDMLDASTPTAGWPALIAVHGGELLTMLIVVVAVRFFLAVFQGLVDNQVIDRGFYNMVAWQATTHVARQSLSFFTNRHSGSILTKVGQAGSALGNFVSGVLSAFWNVIVFIATTLVLFAQLDIRLAALVVVWVAVVVLIGRYFIPRLRRQAATVAEAGAVMNGRIVDVYSNIQTVRLFGTSDTSDLYMREGFSTNLDETRKIGRLSVGLQSAMTLTSSLAFASAAILCIQLWSRGAITVGGVAFALALVMRLNMWLGRLLGSVNGLMRNFGVVQNAMETITHPLEITDAPDALVWSPSQGGISFDQVNFAYLPPQAVIEGFTLKVAPGEKVGLVGRSGAGKTTIVNLLLRFYDLDAGTICIDGQDISRVRQDDLRAGIGVVTQDTALLHRLVRDNILYGRPAATDAEIIAAARQAEAHDFIAGLRDSAGRTGYDAHVGERGIKLSGGQRQRIAIARVILKNAPILVLDEATSALDSEIEAAIQEQFASLMRDKTVLAIAHRLSTIAAMDRLIVMDKGKVIEQGSHAELLARRGLYATLWERQVGGFIAVD